eukprot:4008673-Amphidinium_carterae.1
MAHAHPPHAWSMAFSFHMWLVPRPTGLLTSQAAAGNNDNDSADIRASTTNVKQHTATTTYIDGLS